MKKIIINHFGKIFLLTVLSLFGWIINFITVRHNPFLDALVFTNPNKYLKVDTLIILKTDIWSGDVVLDDDAKSYLVSGYLKNDGRQKTCNLNWVRYGDHPWKYFDTTIIENKQVAFTPVFKNNLNNEIYSIKDPNYLKRETFWMFLTFFFLSIPIFTVPLLSYLFILGYLERKHEKKHF
jgi:hypothetical protein